MTTTKITNHNEQALNRLLQQYKGKEFIEGLVQALFGDQIQDMEDKFRDFYGRLDIDSQEGIQLDNIGELIGQDRLGFSDPTYRILLRARIGRNISEGDIERIISSWKLLTGASTVQLIEVFPAEINLFSDVPVSDELIDTALELINETAASGVAIEIIAVLDTEGDTFGFDGNDDVLGFGDVLDPTLGGKFAYIQTTGTLVVISDPTEAFGFDGVDSTVKGFSNTLVPTVGGKFSYLSSSAGLPIVPIVNLPLATNLDFITGTGVTTFTRSTVKNYIDENDVMQQAAIDTPVFINGRMLFEGPSTNEILHSEDFSNVAWAGGTIVTTNTWTAPDGTLTGDTIEDNSNIVFLKEVQEKTKINETYTASVFIEKDSTGRATRFPLLRMRFSGATVNLADLKIDTSTGEFDLSGTTTIRGAEVFDRGTYWELILTATDNEALNTIVGFEIFPAVGASVSWDNDSTVTGSINIWGAQLEALPFRTSYIPTEASAVTRAADILTLPYTGNFPDISQPVTALINAEFFGDPAANQILWKVVGESSRVSQILSGGVLAKGVYGTSTDSVTVAEDTEHRIGYVYDGTEIEMSVDGVLSGSPSVVDMPTGSPTSIAIGSDGAGVLSFYGYLSNFIVFDTNLDEEFL